MSDLRTAAQQALEALEEVNKSPWLEDCYHAFDDEVTALRAALAEPETPPEAQTEAEKIAYCAGWWDALAKARGSEERNFCSRCGKRTNDIHTCTPPEDADVHR